jgi:hypothetical protein
MISAVGSPEGEDVQNQCSEYPWFWSLAEKFDRTTIRGGVQPGN